jgi:leucyl-tRNA synthetase
VTLDLCDGAGPREFRRETHTMPQWAGSCWYELRYLDPDNSDAFCDPANERYWMGPQGGVDSTDPGGVDLYVGGVEHAVLHLLYARFWHKVLYDLGHVESREPFRRLVTNGYIQAYSYTDARGGRVPADEVEERGGGYWWRDRPVARSLTKMGKSLRNMVSPDEICAEYGADSLRMYVMAMGPLRVDRPWDPRGIVGVHRFLRRVWRLFVDEESGASRELVDREPDAATRSLLHRTIDTVRRDMDDLAFNTAVARLIELVRDASGRGHLSREVAEPLVLMLAPFAPHLGEELWSRLGHPESLTTAEYPSADPAHLVVASVTCVVQVAGRVRDRIEVPAGVAAADLRRQALASPKVQAALAGREVRTIVVRPPGLVNVVPR